MLQKPRLSSWELHSKYKVISVAAENQKQVTGIVMRRYSLLRRQVERHVSVVINGFLDSLKIRTTGSKGMGIVS